MLIFSCGLSGLNAAAAPWLQRDGALYVRVAGAEETIEQLSGWRSDAYVEYGLTPEWTATAKIEHVAYPDDSDFDASGWRATMRRQLLQSGALGLTVEAGLLQGRAIGGRNGCHRLGSELRTGLAWSGSWQERSSFAFAELAGRWHESCQRTRYELGFGRQISDRLWTVSQVWFERGNVNAKSDKIQTELMWRADQFDVSFGYRNEQGGAFLERSVFVALARQF